MAEPGKRGRPAFTASISCQVREMDPNAFGFVMATGVLSAGLRENAATGIADGLLIIAALGYVILCAASGWRLLRWHPDVVAEVVSPRAFSFLAFVAASNVLSTAATAAGERDAAMILFGIGVAGWLALGYGVPLVLITSRWRRRAPHDVDGTWFDWVVGTQSVALPRLHWARSALRSLSWRWLAGRSGCCCIC
jgi:tellurite resistance protein TehA-like permease